MVCWLLLIFLIFALGIEILCNPHKCPPIVVISNQRGDGICNVNCMNPYCNYDAGSFYNSSTIAEMSDCLPQCLKETSSIHFPGDGQCWRYSGVLSCAYDFGYCAYCAPSCQKSQLGNECDPECNTTSCYYDHGACLECSKGCNLTIWGDGICNEECNNSECNYDNGDCFNLTCAPDCYLWMVGNSICDETCYVEECNFDNTDCDCSPGCTLDLLNNDVCDEVCNNLDCNFDSGKCGYCESGCTLEMLKNDVCDEKCNIFKCKYDNFACGCSLYCMAEDYGKCKSSCLVRSCNYDRISNDPSKWCYDENLIKYTIFQHFYEGNPDAIISFDSCLVASSYNCNISMSLDSASCYPECYFKECNFGLCYHKSNSCNKYSGNWCKSCPNGECSECSEDHFSDFCSTIHLNGLEFTYKDVYKDPIFSDFRIYYVTSNQKGPYPSGNGILFSPYESLDYALNSIYTPLEDIPIYTKTLNHILYLYNDGNYTLNVFDAFSIWKHTYTIASYDKTKVLIKINGWSNFSYLVSSQLKFENVIFDGSNQYSSCNNSEYCEYCSYSFYNESDAHYYNDRNQIISEEIPIDSCMFNETVSLSLFNVNSTTLSLINVEIRNFRFNYDSIISGYGKLKLYNVNFDNIWLSGKETNAVIYTYGDGLDIEYIGGSVTRLNNGFEFEDPLDFRGFLYSESYSTFIIKKVTFKYNLVYLKPQSSLSTASLLYINSDMDHIEIDNCTFMYNYCETGIFYSKLNIQSYNSKINETLYLTYLTISHIYFHNLFFISNYGDLGLIHIEFLGYLLNVHFENFTIESNGAESDSLIYIHNQAILDSYKTKAMQTIVLKSSRSITAISIPRWCKIIEISFKNNHAIGMINAINLVNADLKNLNLESNGSLLENANVNSLLLDYFIENSDLYICKIKSDAKAIDCDFMVTLSNSINLDLRGLRISKNVCRNSSPTFIISYSNSCTLSSVKCQGNIGNGLLSVCFYFTEPYDRNFVDSEFFGNINNHISGYGAIKIEGGNILYLTNCFFINNSASSSPAVFFSGVGIFIESSIFDSNKAVQGNGGALYFASEFHANKENYFMISSSDFINNTASADGGAIFLFQKSMLSGSISVTISKNNFKGNNAMHGAALYIDKTVAISKDSIIIDSSFYQNYAKQSGAIYLYFGNGILLIKSCEFIENSSLLASALDIDITEDSENLRSKINIEHSIFRKNNGNSVIYADNQNKNSSIETRNCVFEYNNGRVVSLNFDYFSDNGSVFQFNSASYGSCFYLQNSAILYANSQFLNNTSEEYGGVIAISLKSVFYCENCTFIHNKAKTKGGAINAEQDSQFAIFNSKFENNLSGNDGSAIYAFNCNLAISSLLLSQFFNNYASNVGVINLLSSKITISSCFFSNNSASGYSSGLSLTFSNAEIYDSKFENQSSILGNFIYLLAESNAYLKNATFYNGNAIERGGAIFSSSSILFINDSVFNKLSSSVGGAIYAAFDSQIYINNSKFFYIESSFEGGVISASQVELFIENSSFNQFYHTGINGKQIKNLEITNTLISNGSGYNGGALYCDSCKNIKINSCTFTNNTASLNGGALFLKSNKEINSKISITSSEFFKNLAKNGGAIYSNNINLYIFSSVFKQNNAFSGQDLTNIKVDSGIGGGININCFDLKKCTFSISSCTFIENFAEYNGGGISWNDQVPLFFNNTYQNNVAEYGKDIASYPIKLMQVKSDGSLADFINRRFLSDPISSINLTEIASGQNIKNQFLIALVDDFNNIISTDNLSEAELKSISLATQISGTTQITAKKGIFNFSEFIISDEPGSNIQIMVTSSAIDISKIKISGENFYSNNLVINVNMRKCEIGEVKSGKKCEVCPEGFYSLNPSLISCLACPDAAECYGSYSIVPRPGYWRDNMYTDKFWKCPHQAACLGSPNKSNISYTGECAEAYKGNKCQSCKAGYSHNWSKKCEKCPETTKNILILAGIVTGLIILLVIIIKASRKSALKPKSKVSIYIKIFLNYIQMVILASTFKLNWSPEVLYLFDVQNNADYVYRQIYSCQCLFETNGNNDFIYFKVLILVALIPFFMLALSLLFWLIFKLIKRSYKSFLDDFISTGIILLFLIHPSIVKKMFASMNCTEINTGEYWLEENLDIRCWNYDHIFYVLTVSLPTIILWGLILPTVCLVNIIRNKRKLNEISVRLRYGFLFNGYKDNYFFWEFIILYSKIILICCSVFLTRISLKLQALIVAILYSIYLRLQYSNTPYTEHNLNQMELRAKIVCAVTIWSGVYYLMGSLNDDAGYFFFAIIVVVNCYFLIYWLFYVLKSVFISILQKIKSFRNSKKVNIDKNSLNREDLENSKADFKRIEVSISSNNNLISESQVIEFSQDPINSSLVDNEKIQQQNIEEVIK